MPTLTSDTLTAFARSLFVAAGVPDEEAGIVAGSLVDANLCGHDSHGVIRIPQYLQSVDAGKLRPGAPLKVEREFGAVVTADGGWGFGQVQAHRLLRLLLPRGHELGLAAGTLRQCGHIGRLGEYAEAAAREGFAFMATVNNHGFGRGVAPPGGTAGRIGTNPLCLGAPGDPNPVILDIGTSVVAEGKVRVVYNKGAKAPAGWLLDSQGEPTDDPSVLYKDPRGTIVPLGGLQGGYKGFGLGLLLDLFAGGLSGGPCSNPTIGPQSANAVFFLVIDVERFAGRAHFLEEVRMLSEAVRTCPRKAGVSEILVPGDPERRSREYRAKLGIPLDEGTWGQLKELAGKLKVEVPMSR